ncbi:MAG: EAL domain-containing protein, partial [Oscillospiraceae bacterium]|nr:EAL domain-containing protein [Oscillospiraceae bacterium]
MPGEFRMTEMDSYVLEHFDEALERGYIRPYCQPVVRALTRQICGLEALARWEDPERGLLTPDKFIGVLEECGRIHELDGYIVQQVCAHYHELAAAGATVPVSINLSRRDYELCDIFAVVEQAAAVNRVPRSQLCIEITESTLNQNERRMLDYIDRFRAAGYPVWMDDFGSGYSTLNLLKDFQFDELKIDMQFLSDFHARSKLILASIVNMAKRIGVHTLTEGVETEEEYAFLRNIGCEKLQGSLFGFPIPMLDCPAYARQRGLEWEKPVLRGYYEELGRMNVLSPNPFADSDLPPVDGRELSIIPMALIELRGEDARVLFTNLAFEQVASAVDLRIVFGESWGRPGVAEGAERMQLSAQLRQLLEEARTAGRGRLHLVYEGEYYVLQARRMAIKDDLCSVLLRMENLSRGAELYRQKALDEGLRQIYSIYNWVTLVDLKEGTITPLHLDAREQMMPLTGELKHILNQYAEQSIFPGDRARFLRLVDPDTLSQRVLASGSGAVSANLRTRTHHGAYIWRSYSLVRIQETTYFLLVRDTETEVRELFREGLAFHGEGAIPQEALWASAVQYCPAKFFWKDRERRFCGASQSFLDFYGFESLEEILGKTDEEMSWHIHPDNYRDVEREVLGEGVISYNEPGECIVHGESRKILASKIPVYDSMGDIVGLFGYFTDMAGNAGSSALLAREARRDSLTGLLNSRGLDEEAYAYRDEYELRRRDFVRYDVAIDNLPEINRSYGHDFGDSVIRTVAQALLDCCGVTATVGRLTGSQFAVLRQLDGQFLPEELAQEIRNISGGLHAVSGVPFNAYLSVGCAPYSESGSLEGQASQSQLRRISDDMERSAHWAWKHSTPKAFYMYESLPLGFAVFKLLPGPDLLIIFANRRFADAVG